jgi:hypothetical protein
VAALHSITADVPMQQYVDGVLLYLSKHSQHIDRIQLDGHNFGEATVRQLAPNLQLSSLQFNGLSLQLQPSDCGGWQGVVGPGRLADLKQLGLKQITLLDHMATKALAAALSQLPGLEHLCIDRLSVSPLTGARGVLPAAGLEQLQQLTYLELSGVDIQGPCKAFQALTRLADLRLSACDNRVTANMLSAAHHLTRLELSRGTFEPSALAGKSRLQHLGLNGFTIPRDAGDVAQLLSHVQQLNQLTHLLMCHMPACGLGDPPAAAYSALTASSKLQHLDVSWCMLPAGALQHLFPAGRKLPHLQELDMAYVKQPGELGDICAAAPAGSRLVSCCPGLRCLSMQGLQCSSDLLAPMQGLSGLHSLHLPTCSDEDVDDLHALCQLTGLRKLGLVFEGLAVEGLQLQLLTDLKQLTRLSYHGPVNGTHKMVKVTCKVSSVQFFAPLSFLTCCDCTRFPVTTWSVLRMHTITEPAVECILFDSGVLF